ncbi:hypothetical protein HPB47_012485 [Ixodes persulcatus]|uniref:Uncharacterized protein n=1 Tax=Ixodes persulcatus TaxID=34615 RepID=A0AC60NTH2_IXOPE|nr:hypothetical protein HPB47_012485 [Ixodes persulcatus]
MDRLTSSRASAFVLWCVLLVKHGAGVQPECDFGEFYKLNWPAITTLNFKVTGEFNSPNVLQRDCHATGSRTRHAASSARTRHPEWSSGVPGRHNHDHSGYDGQTRGSDRFEEAPLP